MQRSDHRNAEPVRNEPRGVSPATATILAAQADVVARQASARTSQTQGAASATGAAASATSAGASASTATQAASAAGTSAASAGTAATAAQASATRAGSDRAPRRHRARRRVFSRPFVRFSGAPLRRTLLPPSRRLRGSPRPQDYPTRTRHPRSCAFGTARPGPIRMPMPGPRVPTRQRARRRPELRPVPRQRRPPRVPA